MAHKKLTHEKIKKKRFDAGTGQTRFAITALWVVSHCYMSFKSVSKLFIIFVQGGFFIIKMGNTVFSFYHNCRSVS